MATKAVAQLATRLGGLAMSPHPGLLGARLHTYFEKPKLQCHGRPSSIGAHDLPQVFPRGWTVGLGCLPLRDSAKLARQGTTPWAIPRTETCSRYRIRVAYLSYCSLYQKAAAAIIFVGLQNQTPSPDKFTDSACQGALRPPSHCEGT